MENKLKESPLELLWKKEIKEGISKVAFDDDNIVVGTKDGWIKCFGLEGELKWEYKINNKIYSVSILNDYVIVGLEEDGTYLFDISGEIKSKWRGSIYISDTYILEKRVDSEYYCYLSLFDKNGNHIWKDKIKIKHISVIDFSNKYIAIGTSGTGIDAPSWQVYLFDVDGKLKWKRNVDDEVYVIKILNNYVIALTGNFYLFDMKGNLVIDKFMAEDFSNMWNDYIATGSSWADVKFLDINKRQLKWERMIQRVDSKEELEENIGKSLKEEDKYDSNTYVIGNVIWDIAPELFNTTTSILPHILDGCVFAISYDGYVYLFDIRGNLEWKENIIMNVLGHRQNFCDTYPMFFKDKLLLNIHDRAQNISNVYFFKLKTKLKKLRKTLLL